MSDPIGVLKKVSRFAGKALGATMGLAVGGPLGAVAGYKIGDAGSKALVGGFEKAGLVPKSEAPEPPGVPTIDQAALNQQATDRLRRRRGVLATIYGGANGESPTVGTKALLGS